MPRARTTHGQDWEDLAELDPLWAIAGRADKRFGGWQEEEFFASGEGLVRKALARGAQLGVSLQGTTALEFGCGVGRTTRVLARDFREVVGVDISAEMVRRGHELNARIENVELLHNADGTLGLLDGRRFELVFSRIVLQHLPGRAAIEAAIGELAAHLEPGGLLTFQLPVRLPLRARLQPHRRAYGALRRLGVPPHVLYRRLRLQPVRMTAVPRATVERRLAQAGARVLAVDESTNRAGVRSAIFYATA